MSGETAVSSKIIEASPNTPPMLLVHLHGYNTAATLTKPSSIAIKVIPSAAVKCTEYEHKQ